MINICNNKFPYDNIYNNYFTQYEPLVLSDFQKWAIKAIVDGDNVLITAQTGSGKTLPAEFAINFYKKLGKKVIYASPIKALSNQKLYDMRRKYSHISFGILTGDCKDNPEADVLIMTTEILRNTLFNMQQNNNINKQTLAFNIDIENELAAVVFDEVHYINDAERGSVWEQSILLLPPHVQLIMLSATIDKPEEFASWIYKEKQIQALNLCTIKPLTNQLVISEKNNIYNAIETSECENKTIKKMYLASTSERIVPLTHYMWLSVNNSTIKKAVKTPYEQKLEAVNNIPIVITDSKGVYNEVNYYKVKDILDYNSKHNIYIKRQFVLDGLIRYLKLNNMLPAICFIFSRKQVEQAANECSFSLHDENSEIPAIVEKECRHILMSKLINYKEYLDLPEYHTIVRLLEKGIAIHHAGIMPVLREMIELLFEKGFIKLLFATETFAVGINMPTKTVIFTGLTKFNGATMRLLYPHEYTQMSGRAGRRGIDTVGHIFHCNNLFEIPTSVDYKHLLTGPPQKLISKFKISFNLALNVFATNVSVGENANSINILEQFTNKSLLSTDIKNEIDIYIKEKNELIKLLEQKEQIISLCKTPKSILLKYKELENNLQTTSNSARKKLRNELNTLEVEHKFILSELKYLNSLYEVEKQIEKNVLSTKNNSEYITNVIQCVENILCKNEFLTYNKYITEKGLIASQIQEVHPLVLADAYFETNGFADFSALDIAVIFSCFNNINVNDDVKIYKPQTTNNNVNIISKFMSDRLDYYYDLEIKHIIDTGSSYEINYDLQTYIMDWFLSNDENECKKVIQSIKTEKNIFLGEFIKAILKINNICSEFEKICEMIGNFALLEIIKEIPKATLKYVVTNQSLYV